MITNSWRVAALGAIACLIASGCSTQDPHAKVAGSVSLDGKPLATGVITIIDDSQGAGGSAMIDGGTYAFAEPLPPGDYVVAIQPPPPPPPHEKQLRKPAVALPKYVLTTETSGLSAKLSPGENVVNFDVSMQK